MRSFSFVLPGPPETPTGGFVYDRHMLAGLRRAGLLAEVITLAGNFPNPSGASRSVAERAFAALPDVVAVIVDGLALAPLADVIEACAARLAVIALVHHPLCDETGLAPVHRQRLYDDERRALASVRGVIVTSVHTARRLTDFAVPAARIAVVCPATEKLVRPGAHRHRHDATALRLLCVGSLTPRKGQDILLRALARLRGYAWQLVLVGPLHDPSFARRLRRLAGSLGLTGRIAMPGAVDVTTLDRLYRTADLFVLPSHHEGFGIAAAEAAAYGLPIVASDIGALREALAGAPCQFVPPGDARMLAIALRRFLARPQTCRPTDYAQLRRQRGWVEAGDEFIAALDALIPA